MNRLPVSLQQSILTLYERGWSERRIARELDVHRETVGRHLRASKPAKVAHGSRRACEPFRSAIVAGIAQGLSARRIYQDLVTDHNFAGAFNTVKRFVRALGVNSPLPFRRLETDPGQELQVDFGLGAWIEIDGKMRRPHVFRAVLCFSRKGYSEVVWKQDVFCQNVSSQKEDLFDNFLV